MLFRSLRALAHPYRGLVSPLEAVYRGVSVVVWRDRHVVLARLRNPARHGERRCSRRDHTTRAIGGVPTVSNEPVLVRVMKARGKYGRSYARVDKVDGPALGVIEPRRW